MVSGQQHAPAALYPRGKTRYPFYRRLGGPQGRSGMGGKSRPHRNSIPDRPARSQWLYRLSYPAHKFVVGPLRILLRMRNVSDEEKMETRISCPIIFFSKIVSFMTVWKETKSIVAFLLQQWLRERATMLGYILPVLLIYLYKILTLNLNYLK